MGDVITRNSRRQFLKGRVLSNSRIGTGVGEVGGDRIASDNRPFQQAIRAHPGKADVNRVLGVDGAVQNPCVWTQSDLQQIPAISTECALICSGSTPTHQLVHQRVWTGIPVRALIANAVPLPDAAYALVKCRDGYTTCLAIEDLKESLFVAEPSDGTSHNLQIGTGRLVVPGRAGYKMAKGVERITLTATPVPGFWEERGWPMSGRLPTTAYFSQPHGCEEVSNPVRLSGIAFAGHRLVRAIEISVDDGPWMPVPVQPAQAGSLTRWEITWEAPGPGDYLLRVRAHDDEVSSVVEASIMHDLVLRVRK